MALCSRYWAEFSATGASELNFVFTLCDSAGAGALAGTAHVRALGLPDPAAATGSNTERHLAFADRRRMLSNRIEIFTNLPRESLDELDLQTQPDDIGRSS